MHRQFTQKKFSTFCNFPDIVFLFITFLTIFSSNNSFAASSAFTHGEKQLFQIRWGFIPAGEVTLEVLKPDNSPPDAAYHFILTAKTYPAIDIFYKYREKVESFTSSNVEHSILYKKLLDTRSPRDITVNFDWLKKEAIYTNFKNTLEPILIEPGTLDPLSSLYYIRNQQLHENLILKRPITDGKKAVKGTVKVLKKETLNINGQSIETYKLEPELKDVKGVFEKSKNAKLHIWVTTDHRKMLVKLKSKVRVGSFVAELVETNNLLSPTDQKTD